ADAVADHRSREPDAGSDSDRHLERHPARASPELAGLRGVPILGHRHRPGPAFQLQLLQLHRPEPRIMDQLPSHRTARLAVNPMRTNRTMLRSQLLPAL